MAAAVGGVRDIAGFYHTGGAVIVVFRLTGQNVIGFAFVVVHMVPQRRTGLDGYLRIQPTFTVEFFFAQQSANGHFPVAAGHIFDNINLHRKHSFRDYGPIIPLGQVGCKKKQGVEIFFQNKGAFLLTNGRNMRMIING